MGCRCRVRIVGHPSIGQPIGRIQYEKSGRMMAIIMRPNRTSTIKPQEALSAAGCEEVREAVAGFIGYFGTFSLNASSKTVTHRVEANVVPNGINTELIRGFRFDGDLLVLHRRSADGGQSDELVWERESDWPGGYCPAGGYSLGEPVDAKFPNTTVAGPVNKLPAL